MACNLATGQHCRMSELMAYYVHDYFDDIHDPRTIDYPLVKEPFWMVALMLVAYIAAVKKIIPTVMRDRKPLELRNVMFVYNTVMVVTNAFFFFFFIANCDYGHKLFDFKYPAVDHSDASLSYIYIFSFYWLTKFFDWFDTMFFALRKKDNHISFLHLYHHSMVPFLGWLALRLNPMVPFISLFGITNTLVHTVMYSYYALSSFGPKIQRYLWWKKYITQMQILQFVIYIVYVTTLFIKQVDYPKFWLVFCCLQPPIFFWMFYDFYKRAYRRSKQLSQQQNHQQNHQKSS